MIKIKLDKVMVERKIKLKQLAELVGITEVNLSNLKNGKVSSIRFSTLDAICEHLNCQPKDILEYEYDISKHKKN